MSLYLLHKGFQMTDGQKHTVTVVTEFPAEVEAALLRFMYGMKLRIKERQIIEDETHGKWFRVRFDDSSLIHAGYFSEEYNKSHEWIELS